MSNSSNGRALAALATASTLLIAPTAAIAATSHSRHHAPRRAAHKPAVHHPDRTDTLLTKMFAAGTRIAHAPYSYGGGHSSFDASGYDCSGSVSYVLHAAGLLSTPDDSTGLETFGEPGPGKHVTIFANSGHAFMTINGRRFDTNTLDSTGTRWSHTMRDTSGYVARHPAGL
ncbi:MAG: hypothetical protein J2O48_02720 [Solirubrobacterales bacterium]|nr:hypothetical protein [Solirubrobacterales bacterium]